MPLLPALCRRHSLWLPKKRSLLALALLAGLVAGGLVPRLHPWLAVTQPLEQAPRAVVEGWGYDGVFSRTAGDVKEGKIEHVWVSGGPLERGGYLAEFGTYAHVGGETLRRLGVSPAAVTEAPCEDVQRDRTRAMAEAVKARLEADWPAGQAKRFNLYTLGAHARRSRMVYREVFGPQWEIGVVSVPDPAYDPDHWWRYSAGVKWVISELTSLGYEIIH